MIYNAINDKLLLLWSPVECVKVSEFDPDTLAFLAHKFVGTRQIFWIDTWIGWRHYVAHSFH